VGRRSVAEGARVGLASEKAMLTAALADLRYLDILVRNEWEAAGPTCRRHRAWVGQKRA
jgi:hypothetical protein